MIRRIRLALLILVAVVFQTTVFTHLRVWGVAPEVGLVAVLAIAYEHGPETGAVFGFVMGLAVDLFLTTPVGLSALSYALTGYGVGIVQGGMIRSPRRRERRTGSSAWATVCCARRPTTPRSSTRRSGRMKRA